MRKSYKLYGMRIALSCFWNLLFRKEQEAFLGNEASVPIFWFSFKIYGEDNETHIWFSRVECSVCGVDGMF